MDARVWEQLADGFCSREDDGWPSDADPTARSRGSKQADRADWAASASVARVRGRSALPAQAGAERAERRWTAPSERAARPHGPFCNAAQARCIVKI